MRFVDLLIIPFSFLNAIVCIINIFLSCVLVVCSPLFFSLLLFSLVYFWKEEELK